MKKQLIDCALGNIAADMLITNVNVFHLSDGTLEQCDIAICNGMIAGVGSYKQGKKIIDGSGLYAVPGFIDCHVHWESSLIDV